jgi:hypothetical protein
MKIDNTLVNCLIVISFTLIAVIFIASYLSSGTYKVTQAQIEKSIKTLNSTTNSSNFL